MPKEIRNKLLKKFSDEELLAEITLRSGSKKGLPVKANCFLCSEDFWIKWNQTTGTHSKFHNFEFWSEKKEDQGKLICSSDLRKFYFDLENRRKLSLKKKRYLSSFIVQNIV